MFARLILTGILMTGLVSIALAQRGGPQGPRGDGADGGFGGVPGGGRPYMENRLERFTDMLKLSKEQKSGAKEIFDAAQKEAVPVRDQIQKNRGALATAYLAKQAQADIDQLVATQGNLLAQMAAIELRAFAKLCESLNPDQQKRVGPVFQQMSGMFSGRNWNTIGN